jgi:pilus assembly protein Flp/PilA
MHLRGSIKRKAFIMTDSLKHLMLLKNDRRGVTAMEYGVIAALVVVVLVTAMGLLGPQLTATFGAITTALTP